MRYSALVAVGLVGGVAAAAGDPLAIPGTYDLRAAGDRPVPGGQWGGLVPGEGAQLREGSLTLQPDGRFTARVVVTWTDSGTVDMPSTADGTWRARGATVYLTYVGVKLPPVCWGWVCTDTVRADSGRVSPEGLVLRRLIGLGPRTVGRGGLLRLRRRSE